MVVSRPTEKKQTPFQEDLKELLKHLKACYFIAKRWEAVIEGRKQK